jgi:tetratricopeptide (TPR) repeat protein
MKLLFSYLLTLWLLPVGSMVSPVHSIASRMAAGPQTANRIARESFPSTVLLLADSPRGKHVSLGSGFFVSPNTILTNYHVIRGATRIYAKMIGSTTLLPVERVISTNAKRDLALLAVRGIEAPALRLGASSRLNVGQDIFVIGNPEGLEGTLSTGIISGFRELGGEQYIQITAPISHGSSGGPVLNASGEVIGVAVASLKQGQSLNFAIPIDDVKALLSPNVAVGGVKAAPRNNFDKIAKCEKEFRAQPKSATSYTDLGECYMYLANEKAIDAFKTAISLNPDHAAAYRGLADAYDAASHDRNGLMAAVDALKIASKLQPTADIYCRLGLEYRMLAAFDEADAVGFTDLARQSFLKSLSLAAPDDWANLDCGYGGVGQISLERGDYDDAISNFSKYARVLAAVATFGDEYHGLWEAYEATGHFQEGIANFEDLVSTFKHRLERLRLAKPRDGFSEEVATAINFAWAHLSIGMMYVYAGDKTRALEQYKFLKAMGENGLLGAHENASKAAKWEGVELSKKLLDAIFPSRQ